VHSRLVNRGDAFNDFECIRGREKALKSRQRQRATRAPPHSLDALCERAWRHGRRDVAIGVSHWRSRGPVLRPRCVGMGVNQFRGQRGAVSATLTWSAHMSASGHRIIGGTSHAFKHVCTGMVPGPVGQRSAAMVGRPSLD
jgi:hypothetical protein